MASRPVVIRFEGEDSDLQGTIDGIEGRLGGLGQVAGGVLIADLAGNVAGAALDGLGDAFNQEQITDRLAARLGAFGPEAEELGEIAGNLYAGAWGDSMQEVADAVAVTAQNLGDVIDADELEGLSSRALDFANAMDEDVSTVTRSVGQLLRNDLVGSAEEAFDLIAAAQAGGLNRSEDLLDTVNEYAVSFDRLGLSGADAMGLINQGLEQGVFNTDKIGDLVNEFSIRAIDGSTGVSDAYKMLGLDADEYAARIAAGGEDASVAFATILDELRGIDDQVAQDAAGVALFGSMWEDLGADAVLALEPTGGHLENVEGAAARLGDTLNDNLGTKLESLKRQGFQALVELLEDHVVPIVEVVADWVGERLPGALDVAGDFVEARLIPPVEEMVDLFERHVLPVLQDVVGWIGENEEIIEALGIALGILVAGALAAFVAGLIAAAAPIVAVVGGLTALVFGVRWAYENVEEFRNIVDSVVEFFSTDFVPLMVSVGEWFEQDFAPAVAVAAQHVADFAGDVIDAAEVVIDRLQPIIDLIVRQFERIVIIGIEIVDFVRNIFAGDFEAALGNVATIVSTIIGGIGDNIATIPGFLFGIVLDVAAAAVDVGEAILDGIIGGLGGLVSAAGGIASTIADAIIGALIDAFNTFVSDPVHIAVTEGVDALDSLLGPFVNFDDPERIIPRLYTGGVAQGLAVVGDDPMRPGSGELIDARQGGTTVFNRHETRHRAAAGGPLIGTLIVNGGNPEEIVQHLRVARRRYPL